MRRSLRHQRLEMSKDGKCRRLGFHLAGEAVYFLATTVYMSPASQQATGFCCMCATSMTFSKLLVKHWVMMKKSWH